MAAVQIPLNPIPLQLPQGTTIAFEVGLENRTTGENFTLLPDDTLSLTVKKRQGDKDIVLQKVSNGNLIAFSESDTKDIPKGVYTYDVWLRSPSRDLHYPVITESEFKVLGAVGDD